ncbi:MAG: hypothetical protein ACOVRN_07350 [Flavobacterium sp.]
MLVHHLIQFFKTTLTVPKIKDLVNVPTQKYEQIYSIINHPPKSHEDSSGEYTLIDLLPKPTDEPKSSMKNELKNFLKSQI